MVRPTSMSRRLCAEPPLPSRLFCATAMAFWMQPVPDAIIGTTTDAVRCSISRSTAFSTKPFG